MLQWHEAQPELEERNLWQKNSEGHCDRENELRTHIGS